MAVRSWTHGWDIFFPTTNVIFHGYNSKKEVVHWKGNGYSLISDHADWSIRNDRSYEKLRILFKMLPSEEDLGQFGLGKERTLLQYQTKSGVNFEKRSFIGMEKEQSKDLEMIKNKLTSTEAQVKRLETLLESLNEKMDRLLGEHQINGSVMEL